MSFDLSTQYGDLQLKSPVIVGSCPMTSEELQQIAMVSNGAAAIVLPSLPAEQMQRASCSTNDPVAAYLKLIENTKRRMPIPVIASFSGTSFIEWTALARQFQSAGADGIEFSVRQPQPDQTHDAATIEDSIVECCFSIDQAVDIPFFVKVTKSYTSVGHLSRRLQTTVQGMTLFGRAPTTDIELDNLKRVSKWSLAEPGSIVQSLDSMMRVSTICPDLSIAASGGILNSTDLIKALLAGADAVMITSAIYRCGATVIGSMLEGLTHFMETHHIHSIDELRAFRPAFENHSIAQTNKVEKCLPASDAIALSNTESVAIACDRWGHPKTTN